MKLGIWRFLLGYYLTRFFFLLFLKSLFFQTRKLAKSKMFPDSLPTHPLNTHIYVTFWYITIFFVVKICKSSERKVGVCVKNVLISSLSPQAIGNGGLSIETRKSSYYHLNIFHSSNLYCSFILEFGIKVTLLQFFATLGFHSAPTMCWGVSVKAGRAE